MSNQNQMVGGCCICLDERGWKENPLVYCDGAGCNVAVHKNCYGIIKVPPGPWYCQKCDSKETGDNVRCCLCPKVEGVLKKTEDDRWAHVLCALYVPEIQFGNVTTMEPIIVGKIPASSFNTKICFICEEIGAPEKDLGVCLTCAKPNCKVVFHVSCGQSRDLLVEEQVSGASLGSVEYRGYCPAHAKKNKSSKNSPADLQAKSDSGSGAEDKKNFSVPLTVDIADKPKARSRAKPQANNANGAKPKRARKPAAKKNAAATAKLSPQLKSPLRSPLRSPSMRSPLLLSPGRSPISLVPTTSARGLLEQQFELGQKMLENQAPLDIAQLLNCIGKIQQENIALEAELQQLTSRRDNLVSVNARLTLPMPTTSTHATSQSNTLPSMLTNGSVKSLSAAVPRSLTNNTRPVVLPTQSSHMSSQLPPLALSSHSNTHPMQRPSITSSNREPVASQARKRQSESVIKVNSKQPKSAATTSPAMNKPLSKSATHPSLSSANDSTHFPWPAPVPQARPSSVNSSTPTPTADSNYNQSVNSRLPSIDALSQSRVPPQQMPPCSAYMNTAGTLASYTVNSNAAAALAANYSSYPQFPMFPMSGLTDMATLNPSALTGLAMQGLHNSQQYYRAAADASAQNSKPN